MNDGDDFKAELLQQKIPNSIKTIYEIFKTERRKPNPRNWFRYL